MVDWTKIRAEYISGGTSYRKLAEKYGVSFNTLKTHAVEEQWYKLRQQKDKRTTTKIIEAVSAKEARKADKIIDAADRLIDRIFEILPMVENPTGLRDLTTALKNLRDIKGIKSDADMREQEARIRNLEKQAQHEEESKDIVITIASDAEDYSR